MKAQDLSFLELIGGAKQFVIPIFQRTYSWELCHCEQLWRDIIRVGSQSDVDCKHFIGSIVYIPEQGAGAAIPRWLVIDGQQRITTIILLLLSLMRQLEAKELSKPLSAAQVEDYYLKNRYGKGEDIYKMLLTKTDKDTLIALLNGKKPPASTSRCIIDNYEFFNKRIATEDWNVVYRGIQRLMIVDVRLHQKQDNPQMIFESMNSTGKALTQADLIRNFVLMGIPHREQTRLYNDYWHPIELDFGAESYNKQFDEFMRYFLVIHTGNHRIKKNEVYQEFKIYSQNSAVEDILIKLKEFSEYYCCIALAGKEDDKDLAQVFQDIRELRADVCHPLIMEMYHDYKQQHLCKKDFVDAVLLVESYVFRRAVCDIPTNSLRQTFGTFSRQIKKDNYIESIKANFLLLPSYRRFPNDDEFKRHLKDRNLYQFNKRSYWLRRFENHERKERVMVLDYTVEHIMPQSDNLTLEWQQALGDDWKRIHEKYLHTLGNLTLTGYNSEYGKRPFQEKRDMEGGFRDSPIRLNHGLADCKEWNEVTINKRAKRLANKAIDIWKAPMLAEDILKDYRIEEKKDTIYSIGTHPHLLSDGATRKLFNEFRAEVLALDECIREEFLKHYVAYKAETNFVDVVPQAKRLRLSLNLDFSDIDDPRHLCKDITNIGRLGNGNVEVGLENIEDIPYVIGLVRQSLERQLGNENTEE